MTDQEFKDLYTWMLRNFTNPKPELAEEWHRKIGRTDYDVAFTAVDRISDVRKSFPTYPDFWKAYEEVKGERKAEQQGEKECHPKFLFEPESCHVIPYRSEACEFQECFCLAEVQQEGLCLPGNS